MNRAEKNLRPRHIFPANFLLKFRHVWNNCFENFQDSLQVRQNFLTTDKTQADSNVKNFPATCPIFHKNCNSYFGANYLKLDLIKERLHDFNLKEKEFPKVYKTLVELYLDKVQL